MLGLAKFLVLTTSFATLVLGVTVSSRDAQVDEASISAKRPSFTVPTLTQIRVC